MKYINSLVNKINRTLCLGSFPIQLIVNIKVVYNISFSLGFTLLLVGSIIVVSFKFQFSSRVSQNYIHGSGVIEESF